MYLAFKNANPASLLKQIKNIDYTLIIVSMFFGFLAIVSRGLRWIVLLNNLDYKVKRSNSIYAVAIGYVTNIAIPRAGEITRCTSLNQTENIPVDKLFGTIIVERIIDLLILLLLIGLTFILKFELFLAFITSLTSGHEVNFTEIIFVLIGVLGVVTSIYFLIRKRIQKLEFFKKIPAFLKGVKDGMKSIKSMKNQTSFWFHTFAIWFMYLLMITICFYALEETSHLGVSDGIYALVIGGLGMLAPVQGGIGAYHYAVKTGLELLDIASDPALLFATVVHAAQTIMTFGVGCFSLLMVFLYKRKINRDNAEQSK